MVQVEFTKEEIGEHGIGNAMGFCFGTIAYLHSKGLSVEEWAEYIGQMHASGWEGVKGEGALVVLRVALVNWISCGANLISYAGDENRAEAVLEWPPEWYEGVPFEVAHKINAVFHPILRFVGLKCAWKSEGRQFRLTFFKE